MKLFRSIQRARGAAAAVGAALLLLTTSAHADFVNGGFEQSPDFTGWTTPGFEIPRAFSIYVLTYPAEAK